MKRADYEYDDIANFLADAKVEAPHVFKVPKVPPSKRSPPRGLIAAIEHAIGVQNWDEARRLASREDSGDEI